MHDPKNSQTLRLAEAGQDESLGWWGRPTPSGSAVLEPNAPVPAGIARSLDAAPSHARKPAGGGER